MADCVYIVMSLTHMIILMIHDAYTKHFNEASEWTKRRHSQETAIEDSTTKIERANYTGKTALYASHYSLLSKNTNTFSN